MRGFFFVLGLDLGNTKDYYIWIGGFTVTKEIDQARLIREQAKEIERLKDIIEELKARVK